MSRHKDTVMRITTRRITTRFVALAVAAPMMLSTVAATPPGFDARTETLYISAGCPQSTPGTCTSTRWLGKTSGDATSNFLTATTPADEVTFRAQGSINWRDYASDSSLDPAGYLLDVDRDLEVDVTLSTNGVAINDTVHARATLSLCNRSETGALTGCASTVLTAANQTVTMLPLSTTTVPFKLDLPPAMSGKVLRSLTVEIAVHGVNAQGGYIDQQGGSPVRIPYMVPTPPA